MSIVNTSLFKQHFLLGIILFCTILSFTSCTKQNDVIVTPPLPFSEEKYIMEITGNWALPFFTVPINAHFTKYVGMVHAKDTFMWKPNALATLGLERVAEDGSNGTVLNEMKAMITAQKALSVFLFTQGNVTASTTDTLTVNTNCSAISFASMIAPTPDWFIGLSNFNCIENNKWLNEATIPLYVYDAGTEDGDVFGYINPSTNPQQPIHLLTPNNATVLANGNAKMQIMAYVKFKRIIK